MHRRALWLVSILLVEPVAGGLCGSPRFIGSLMNQMPLSAIGADTPLFPFGYGLTTEDAE